MAECREGISDKESSCARICEQQGEEPARDQQQPFPATADLPTRSQQQPFLQEGQQYKYDVVNPPTDEAICPVCLDLAVHPYLVECCGQHFCQQCLTDIRAKGNVCPLCRASSPAAMHNKHFERNVIHKLQVRCSEKENGCLWEGLLGELQHHLMQCQYVEEDCPYKCGDRVQRCHLEEHKAKLCPQRSYDCGYCGHTGTYREVTDQHWSLCVSFPLACPNKCGSKNIPRGELQEHCSSKCPLQEVACDFSHAGCKMRVLRQDLSKHMSDAAQQHMALVSQALLQDKEKDIAQLKQQLGEKKQQHKKEMVRIAEEHKQAAELKDQLHKAERKKNDELHRQELAMKDEKIAKLIEECQQALERKDQLHKKERKQEMAKKEEEITRKDREHKQEMAKKEEEMARKDREHKKEMAKKEEEVAKKEEDIVRKDREHKQEMAKKEEEMARKDREHKKEMAKKEEEMAKKEEEIARKDREHKKEMAKKEEEMAKKEEEMARKDGEHKQEMAKKEEEITRKDREHKKEMAKKEEEMARKDREHKQEMAKKEEEIVRKDREHKQEMAKKEEEIARKDRKHKKEMAKKEEEMAKKEDEITRKDREHKQEMAKKEEEITSKDREHRQEMEKKEEEIARREIVFQLEDKFPYEDMFLARYEVHMKMRKAFNKTNDMCKFLDSSVAKEHPMFANLYIVSVAHLHSHMSVYCDKCKTRIDGSWYRNIEIVEHCDLCPTCFFGGTRSRPFSHRSDHLFLMINSDHRCSRCDMLILSHRFHSNTQPNFDLCLGCFRREQKEGRKDSWTVYLLRTIPATAKHNKYLSCEEGTALGVKYMN